MACKTGVTGEATGTQGGNSINLENNPKMVFKFYSSSGINQKVTDITHTRIKHAIIFYDQLKFNTDKTAGKISDFLSDFKA